MFKYSVWHVSITEYRSCTIFSWLSACFTSCTFSNRARISFFYMALIMGGLPSPIGPFVGQSSAL